MQKALGSPIEAARLAASAWGNAGTPCRITHDQGAIQEKTRSAFKKSKKWARRWASAFSVFIGIRPFLQSANRRPASTGDRNLEFSACCFDLFIHYPGKPPA
jgi:hypothetical protein